MKLLYADILLQRAACYMGYWQAITNPERKAISGKLRASLDDAAGLLSSMNYGRRREMLSSLQRAAGDAGALS
jgi:hypothetical protein